MKRMSVVVGVLAVLGVCVGAFLTSCTWLFPVGIDFVASSTEGYRPMPVAFTPLHTESAVAYEWDFGDGAISSDPAPTHIYREAGTYTVGLSITSTDGTILRVVKDDLITVGVVQMKEAPARIYWISYNASRIMYGTRSGTESGVLVNGLRIPTALAVDEQSIYWADSGDGSINRANLDGSNPVTLVTGLHRPSSLSMDIAHTALYCVTHPSDYYTVGAFEGTVLRIRLDNLERTVVASYGMNPSYYADEIAVDPKSNRLYWTLIENALVGPVSYDPKSIPGCQESIQTSDSAGTTITTFKGQICSPGGVAVDSIPTFAAERVYWTSSTNGRILSCKTDGTNMTILADDLEYPMSIAVDRLEGKVYFSSEEGIHRMNLDGTDPELIFPGVRTSTLAL